MILFGSRFIYGILNNPVYSGLFFALIVLYSLVFWLTFLQWFISIVAWKKNRKEKNYCIWTTVWIIIQRLHSHLMDSNLTIILLNGNWLMSIVGSRPESIIIYPQGSTQAKQKKKKIVTWGDPQVVISRVRGKFFDFDVIAKQNVTVLAQFNFVTSWKCVWKNI